TIYSNQPVLKVNPCLVDSLETIHDFADISDVNRHFSDYLPDVIVKYWLWILCGLLIAGLGVWFWYSRRNRGELSEEKKVPLLPPYEEAKAALSTLRGENLCQKGMEKEFYTRLTDILRHYLDRRFGINAMEMTSSQIMDALQSNEETRLSQSKMKRVLEMADFVKFAKVRPLPADNTASFNSAEAFIDETRPVPDHTEENSGETQEQKISETSKKD
ncbi:MAG: cell wall anchor protein, partial [Duncaniella sp.]|nr:cell wall anchor protein [Duncaniella sp.]